MADVDPLSADFARRFPDSFARVLGRGDAKEVSRVLEKLPPGIKASIVARLPASRLEPLLSSRRHAPEQWLVDAPFDDAITLLSRIPRERRLALVNSLSDRDRRRRLLRHQQYPAHSVGALVSDVPLRISTDSPAADVLRELRGLEGDDPGPLVVIDAEGRYLGLLDRWRLMAQHSPVGTARDFVRKVSPIYPEMSIASVAQNPDWHTHNWLPVVDHGRRILGGVSRARVFGAAGVQKSKVGSASDVMIDLMTDLVYVLGALLDRVLARRGSS